MELFHTGRIICFDGFVENKFVRTRWKFPSFRYENFDLQIVARFKVLSVIYY